MNAATVFLVGVRAKNAGVSCVLPASHTGVSRPSGPKTPKKSQKGLPGLSGLFWGTFRPFWV